MKITNEQIEEARLCAAMRTGGADLASMPMRDIERICSGAMREVCAGQIAFRVWVDRSVNQLHIDDVPRARIGSVDTIELFDRLFPDDEFEIVVSFAKVR